MNPWLAYLLGVFTPTILVCFGLGLGWIIWRNTKRKELDMYSLRDARRRAIIAAPCNGVPLPLSFFPPEDRKVLEEVTR